MNAHRSIVVLALTVGAASAGGAQTPAIPSSTGQPPGVPFIEQMTWTEVRDAIAAGKITVIIPVGGVEQNGPHMVLGKHNYIVTFAARVMAERLGNALVAPVVAWVPEGNYNSASFGTRPGAISNPAPGYQSLLDAAVRSLRVHGFTDILLIGDSGGNQGGIRSVADSINKEWAGTGARVYALVDYYEKSRADLRAWLLAEYGYDGATVGSHAGISDTSQLMYIFAGGIRPEKIMPGGGGRASGVNGDPTKATVEIGKKAIDFKVNAGIAQYRALKGT
jgi:creatinine amidohydrolase